jgi:hypothetical protein
MTTIFRSLFQVAMLMPTATADAGYSSEGDISSMYDIYSLLKALKPREHKRSFHFVNKSVGVPSSLSRTAVPINSPGPFDIFIFYGANVFSEPGGHKY